ncbi:flavin monoamine oxidase family protein [Sediminicola luteus]|uniref:flavin monoamine oxidase family protein n=1 Tax=Sediminicola luteus TaxID=319238 RepID=UPI0015576811|nr:FAD-dependent oxidoreductase [Sediminicola luteus]
MGAGISGLAAANYFKDKGVNPIVLEASDKIGGRLRTDRSLGIAFDEGASWIHGPKGNPITSLATESGANTFLTRDDLVKVYDFNGTPYAESVLDKAEAQYRKNLNRLNGNTHQSFGDAFYGQHPQLRNDRLWTYMLSAFLEFDTGGDINKLSSTYFYDDEAFRGDDVIITNGFDRVTDFLAKGIDVRLNTKVQKIDYSQEKTIISTSQGQFEADYVLVTVPLGVLKQGVITFNPSLPKPTQNAINGLEMGSVNKFLLTWDAPFWDNQLQYIGYTPEQKGKFNYFLNVSKFTNAHALMTFAFGDYSKATESMSDAAITHEIMGHLKIIYGQDIPEPTHMLRTKWNIDSYTFGSYSFATKGTTAADFEVFEEPVDNKIFFAGEHTIVDYRGTVHGAYLSGIREAKKILRQY